MEEERNSYLDDLLQTVAKADPQDLIELHDDLYQELISGAFCDHYDLDLDEPVDSFGEILNAFCAFIGYEAIS